MTAPMAATLPHYSQRRMQRRRSRPISDINVTPLVDVMLVLLVIFMITAPLLTAGVQVDLPKTMAAHIPGEDEPLAVTVDKDGRIYLQETELELAALAPRLAAIAGNNLDVRIFIRGDAAIDYGRVMTVMGAINAAGFTRVALVTQRIEIAPTAATEGDQ
jgi:biopolymer transport protein TolR